MRLLAALCVSSAFLAVAAERILDLEFVLAADGSGSTDRHETTLHRQGFVNELRHPKVIKAIKVRILSRVSITYVEWAAAYYQRSLVSWIKITNTAKAFADAVARPEVTIER